MFLYVLLCQPDAAKYLQIKSAIKLLIFVFIFFKALALILISFYSSFLLIYLQMLISF